MAFDGSVMSVTIGGVGSGQLTAHTKPPMGGGGAPGRAPRLRSRPHTPIKWGYVAPLGHITLKSGVLAAAAFSPSLFQPCVGGAPVILWRAAKMVSGEGAQGGVAKGGRRPQG